MKRKFIYIFSLILLTSCLHDQQLKKCCWKYGYGYHIGDVISFDRYELRNDTLFLENTPKAVLFRREASILGFTDNKIIIKDITSNKKGGYYQK